MVAERTVYDLGGWNLLGLPLTQSGLEVLEGREPVIYLAVRSNLDALDGAAVELWPMPNLFPLLR